MPYAGTIGHSFLFMDDNARPHRAGLVDDMLEEEGIERFQWLASSPDLNPIEPVWDALGRRIADRPARPTTVPQLQIARKNSGHISHSCRLLVRIVATYPTRTH